MLLRNLKASVNRALRPARDRFATADGFLGRADHHLKQDHETMRIERRSLLVGGAAALASRAALSRGAVRLSDFGGRANGEDCSDAFAKALAAAAAEGLDLELDEGTTRVASAPGSVADPARHDCPEVRHRTIRIRGRGPDRSRLACRPMPTAMNPSLPVSRPILKSVGAETFVLSDLTLDGGIAVGERGLRKGADPTAAALLEVRGARRCELSNVTVTGFAGHWDDRDPLGGAYGRRGPVLLADCSEVLLKTVTLKHPTFREGIFVHSAERVLVSGFRLAAGAAGRVSTPLHIMGLRSREVTIEDFSADPAWTGSLLNLGGPGRFLIRRLRAKGAAQAFEGREDRSAPLAGRGIDIGSEPNDGVFPGQPETTLLRLEDVVLTDSFVYGIKATRRQACPLGTLSLGPGVRVDGGSRALDASFVGRIEGAFQSVRTERQRSGVPAVLLRDCGSGTLKVDLTEPLEGAPASKVDDGSGDEGRSPAAYGVVRLRAGSLSLSGTIRGFGQGALLVDVAKDEDGLHDATVENLSVERPPEKGRPAIRMGRGPQRRLRVARLANCRINGKAVDPSDPGLAIQAVRIET